ncbi:hypothetical protein C7B77_04865 [Chamaesiphon polymorphus CCALA 037]|uniref:Uncharacterized protein n=1 Tax=Chamaesiphon polymorphus CCALA 037 TaxID=2107692 RepID=A0A2T1GKR6_9CYAN|nr:hypothetical protein C7B77_04865 [Chamaesiphon polymorphus CCALA 037]
MPTGGECDRDLSLITRRDIEHLSVFTELKSRSLTIVPIDYTTKLTLSIASQAITRELATAQIDRNCSHHESENLRHCRCRSTRSIRQKE